MKISNRLIPYLRNTLQNNVKPVRRTNRGRMARGSELSESRCLLAATFSSSNIFLPVSGSFGTIAADLNGDSNPDIAVSNSIGNIYVSLGNGSGGFSTTVFSTGVSQPDVFSLAHGQISGSSLPELVVGSFNSNGVRVMSNNGGGSFSQGLFFSAGGPVTGVAVGDINGDGTNDIVASRYNQASVIVFYLNSAGGLITSSVLSTGTQPREVIIADLDGDGRRDIVTANGGSNSLTVLRNLGGGPAAGFATSTLSPGNTPVGVHAADFSGDGLLDLVTTNVNSGTVTYFRNTGGGNFTTQQNISVGSDPWGITSIDFDRDGRLDLAVARRVGNSVQILRNNGGTSFVTDSSFSASSPFEIVAADFNKDGRTDLASSSANHSVINILAGTSNSAPTEITLTNSSIDENVASGFIVGTLSATDLNTTDTHTFSLVSGAGATDNAKFSIVGNALCTAQSVDFETQSTYTIRVRAADLYGGTFEKALTISVNDLNENPTDIQLTGNTVAENADIETLIGTLSSTDPDAADTFTYTFAAGEGDADNGYFLIDGGSLRTNAVFDYETRSSYSVRVRTADLGGLWFEKVFTIFVIDVDEIAPESLIAALPANSNSLTFPISVSAVDPGGLAASGVFEIDFYYSIGGSFIKFATTPASNPSADFTGSANTTYWFRSIARDNAGNVESKTTADTYTRIGDVVPPTTQVTSATHNSSGLFTIDMTGSKVGGAPLTAFDVYVVIDSNAPVYVGTAGAGVATAGVYSASLSYQGLTDGNSHTYRFYSVGTDSTGNVEAAPPAGDVTVTATFSSKGLSLGAIDVQNGAGQRSYIRYLDLMFSSSTGVSALANTSRVRVERFGIDATSVTPGTGALVSGFSVNQSGNRLKLDFGATGLGGLRHAGNGFYRVLVDIDGNGNFTDASGGAMEFHRLFGDADGNGIVNIADTNLVTSQIGRSGTNLDGDLDGNGIVNSTDRLFTVQQRGKKLLDSLLGWLDD